MCHLVVPLHLALCAINISFKISQDFMESMYPNEVHKAFGREMATYPKSSIILNRIIINSKTTDCLLAKKKRSFFLCLT